MPVSQPRPARTFGSLHAPVSLLDAAGTVVVLPFSHTLSFARYCAQHGVQRMRRFCVSRVFRHDVGTAGSSSAGGGGGGGGKKSGGGGGSVKGASGVVGLQPRETVEASFDAIIEAARPPVEVAFLVAESMACAREMISDFGPLLNASFASSSSASASASASTSLALSSAAAAAASKPRRFQIRINHLGLLDAVLIAALANLVQIAGF